MDENFEGVTLDNIAEGKLLKLFEDMLADVSEVLENPGRFAHNKDGELVLSIDLRLDLTKQDDSTYVGVYVSGNLKRPRVAALARSMFYDRGIFTQSTRKQAPLPLEAEMAPTPIRGRGRGSEGDSAS